MTSTKLGNEVCGIGVRVYIIEQIAHTHTPSILVETLYATGLELILDSGGEGMGQERGVLQKLVRGKGGRAFFGFSRVVLLRMDGTDERMRGG